MATTLANINIKDNSSWNTYLNLIYPVGSVYFATNNTSPASRFGGTWSVISNWRYLRFTGDYSTGGQEDLLITAGHLPPHVHRFDSYARYEVGYSGVGRANGAVGYNTIDSEYQHLITTGAYATSSVGGGSAFIPTYQSFYCWVRTA